MHLALVSLLGVLAVCNGAALQNLDPKIVNGEIVKEGEIPYQVSLQVNKRHFCGGSVLNANYVLTAAHCMVSKNANTVQVIVGTTNLDAPGSVHQAEKIIIHKSYNPSDSWKDDIALIKVKQPFARGPKVSYVPLPKENEVVAARSPAVVSGWGAQGSGQATTKKMYKARISIADQNVCLRAYQPVHKNIYNSHICANDPNVEKGSCQGDSGGPLTVNGKIVGIVSWSMGCALTNYPSVYTRVTSYLSWIRQNTV